MILRRCCSGATLCGKWGLMTSRRVTIRNVVSSSEGGGSTYRAPAVRKPPLARLLELNEKWGLELTKDELEGLRSCMGGAVESYNRVDALANPSPPVTFPRLPGHIPSVEDNPFNAWYCKTEIQGAGDGRLRGRSVAIKDSIPVAGVPMMNGSRILEGYVPDFDATVVTRVLEAGGIVAGKAVSEDLCCSGSSFATARGPVRNPHNEDYSAGGSSSGCAALVAGGAVDMAIGSDQGGSVRIPASWCGIVGLKPTFGLVPFTGSSSHEASVDHLGPMARTVTDTALLLETIAGYDDGLDHRQPRDMKVQDYTGMLSKGVEGLKIAVLQEGLDTCEDDVKEACMHAAGVLREAGATVNSASIPMHRDSAAIWLPLCLEGGHVTRMQGGGVGMHFRGFYPTSLQRAYRRGFQCHAAELSYTNMFYILFGEYIRETYGFMYYGKAQNLSRALARAYDDVLATYDAIIMPTMPLKPTRLLREGANVSDFIGQAWCMLQNTAASDLTGHPALSVNVGFSKPAGLPVGLQVVGRQWDDGQVLNVAHALETRLRLKKDDVQ